MENPQKPNLAVFTAKTKAEQTMATVSFVSTFYFFLF